MYSHVSFEIINLRICYYTNFSNYLSFHLIILIIFRREQPAVDYEKLYFMVNFGKFSMAGFRFILRVQTFARISIIRNELVFSLFLLMGLSFFRFYASNHLNKVSRNSNRKFQFLLLHVFPSPLLSDILDLKWISLYRCLIE